MITIFVHAIILLQLFGCKVPLYSSEKWHFTVFVMVYLLS